MERQEIPDYVVRELGRGRSRNEVIREICEQAGLNWPEAEALVKHISAEKRGEITGRQKPIMYAIGIITLLAGIGLAGGIAVVTLQGIIILFLKLPIPYLGNLVYFLIGMAMIAGSISGLMDLAKKE